MIPLPELLVFSDTIVSSAMERYTGVRPHTVLPPLQPDDHPLRIMDACRQHDLYWKVCGFIFDERTLRSAVNVLETLYMTERPTLKTPGSISMHTQGEPHIILNFFSLAKTLAKHPSEDQDTVIQFFNVRRVYVLTLLWSATMGRLADTVDAITAALNSTPYSDFHTPQQTLHLYTVQLFMTTLQTVQPDTPWAWQEPLLIDQLIHAVNSDDMQTIEQAVCEYGL